MVLYHAITMYHLLNAIVHKLTYHKNEDAILILPDFFVHKMDEIKCKKLTEKDIFQEVLFFPYKEVKPLEEKFEKHLEFLWNKPTDYPIKTFDSYYIWGVHFYFSILLIENHIKFNAFEEASGAFTRQNILVDALQQKDTTHLDIAIKYKIIDYSSPYIIKTYCNLSAQKTTNFKQINIEDFNINNLLMSLNSSDQNKIIHFFDAPSIDLKKNTAILLTQHFMNLDILTYDEQALIYKTFIDYFLSKYQIIIKPHPDDFMNYNLILQNCSVLPKSFPTELLPLLSTSKIELCSTIYSTAMEQLKDICNDILNINMDFRETYTRCALYYTALMILKHLNPNANKITLIGGNTEQLQAIGKYTLGYHHFNIISELELANSMYIIIDDIHTSKYSRTDIQDFLQNLDNRTIIIFLNSQKDYCYYDYSCKHIAYEMYPIEIKHLPYHQNQKAYTECIYIYTKRKGFKNLMSEFSYEKNLENIQEKISVNGLTPEQIQIKALQGILKATEERLLYYINLYEKGDE